MNKTFAHSVGLASLMLFVDPVMSADAPMLAHQQCLGLKFLNQTGSPLEIQNTCSHSIELKYCLTDHPEFVKGDTQATCLKQGIRTTGKIAPGQTVIILRNIVFPSTADDRGMAGIYFQGCNMSPRDVVCRIAHNNQPPFSNGSDYRILSLEETERLEGRSNAGKRNSDPIM